MRCNKPCPLCPRKRTSLTLLGVNVNHWKPKGLKRSLLARPFAFGEADGAKAQEMRYDFGAASNVSTGVGQTCRCPSAMSALSSIRSALPPKTDMEATRMNVRYGPIADLCPKFPLKFEPYGRGCVFTPKWSTQCNIPTSVLDLARTAARTGMESECW
jgi:hypothetical protein